MSLRFVDGVSHYDTSWIFVKWPQNNGAIVNTSIFKSGRASLELDGAYVQRQFPNVSEHWKFGMHIRWKSGAAAFPSQTMILQCGSPQFPATKELWYTQANDISDNPHFEIWGNGAPDGSGPGGEQPYTRLAHWDFTIVQNVWYYLEFFGNPFAYEWYKLAWDGTTVISEVTGPATGPIGDFTFKIINGASASVPGMYVDTIYGVNNTTPIITSLVDFIATPTNIPEVVTIHPSTQGNYQEWDDRFPIGARSAGHVDYVDEILVNGSDYLIDRHVGERETFLMKNVPELPTVLGVQSSLTLLPVANNSIGIGHLLRGPSSSPIDSVSSVEDSHVGSEERPSNISAEFPPSQQVGIWRTYVVVWEEKPVSRTPWTASIINDTEFGMEILSLSSPEGPVGNPLWFTQHVLEVLVSSFIVEPVLPEDQPGIAQVKTKVHSYARLWKIETGSVVFRFTDHNQNLINPIDNLVYTPIEGIKTSAQSRELGLSPGSMELQGIINQDGSELDYDMLHGTTMRGSKITEYLVDWVYPWAGILTRDVGFLDLITYDSEKWFATVFSQLIPLTWPTGKLYSRVCRHILGDEGCQFDLLTLKETSIAVSSIPTTVRNRSFFTASGLPTSSDAQGNDRSANGYWSFGTLTWVTGSNVGLSHEIQSSEELGKIVLSVPTPFIIEVGDDFDITPGCDKLLGSCNIKFDNLPNFGGYPTVPGYDRAHQPLGTSTRVFGIGDFLDLLL